MKKLYERLYYELYLVVSVVNKDPTSFAIILLVPMLLMNIITILGLLDIISGKIIIHFTRWLSIGIASGLMVLNFIYFFSKKRYKRILLKYKKHENLGYGWIYIIVSFILFYIIVKVKDNQRLLDNL